MIDVFASMQGLLREAGFITHLTSIDRRSVVCFEDEVLTGVGCVFDTSESLLTDWRAVELSFLKYYALDLRAAGDKAWNVYCVFLCPASADPVQAREVSWIEENLDRTRKIAACGLASRENLIQALLPILPLQYQPVLGAEDASERLVARVRTIAPGASDAVLDDSIPAERVVALLGESA